MLGRFLLGSIVALLLVLMGCAKKEETSKTEEQAKKVETMAMKVTDPVCGIEIEHKGAITAEYRGRAYHFCSIDCKDKFEKEPEKFLK